MSPDGPRPVGDALRRVQRELGAPPASVLDQIREDWPELVGDALAAHSAPIVLRSGVLRIGVDDPAWRGQFRYLTDQLIAALAERMPAAGVSEITVGTTTEPPGRGPASDPDRA